MKCKTFKEWFKEQYPEDFPESETISGGWFHNRGIPMVVRCAGCETTMCVVSACIDEKGITWCSSCAGCTDAE